MRTDRAPVVTAAIGLVTALVAFTSWTVLGVAPPSTARMAASVPLSSSFAAGDLLVVATDGSDSNPGTEAEPLLSLATAVERAQPGTLIQVRGGTYALTTNLQLLKSGEAGKPITLAGYPGENVIIDGENLPNTPAPVGGSIPAAQRGAIRLEGSYWTLTDLEIVNSPYAVYCSGCDHTVLDRLRTHDNYETGVQLQGAAGDNQVLNLDSYRNRDPRKNGESADGLGIKEGSGTGNVVRGARLWDNVDDGFDAWEFLSPILIEDSISYGNGFNRWDFPDFGGDGNGFKLGGGDEDLPADHVVRNSMAFGNSAGGLIDNSNPGALTLERTTTYDNAGTGIDVDSGSSALSRNLSLGNGIDASLGASTGTGNSWDLATVPTLASTDPALVTGPRTADGSIPASDFLRPADGTDLGARL